MFRLGLLLTCAMSVAVVQAQAPTQTRRHRPRAVRVETSVKVESGRATGQNKSMPSVASEAGHIRGTSEGRLAGREDSASGRASEPDARAELERADSGYYSQLGALSEYQKGYREGFQVGYQEGFGGL
jgi:hypothetical protein